MPSGEYVIYELPIYTQDTTNTYSDNDEHACVISFKLGLSGASLPDDIMYVKNKKVPQKTTVFFVKKWQGVSMVIKNYKCKHYANLLQVQYSVSKSGLYAKQYPINSYSWWSYYYQ